MPTRQKKTTIVVALVLLMVASAVTALIVKPCVGTATSNCSIVQAECCSCGTDCPCEQCCRSDAGCTCNVCECDCCMPDYCAAAPK